MNLRKRLRQTWTRQDPRGARIDPRESQWLPLVTALVCVGEGALVTLLLFIFRDSLLQLTSLLARSSAQVLGFAAGSGSALLRFEQFWIVALVTASVFALLATLMAARKMTWRYLESTHTTTGPFLYRKAATLSRLDGLLPSDSHHR